MVSYVGENYPTSYDQIGKYVSIYYICTYVSKLLTCAIVHISDVLYQQFAQLVFPI